MTDDSSSPVRVFFDEPLERVAIERFHTDLACLLAPPDQTRVTLIEHDGARYAVIRTGDQVRAVYRINALDGLSDASEQRTAFVTTALWRNRRAYLEEIAQPDSCWPSIYGRGRPVSPNERAKIRDEIARLDVAIGDR